MFLFLTAIGLTLGKVVERNKWENTAFLCLEGTNLHQAGICTFHILTPSLPRAPLSPSQVAGSLHLEDPTRVCVSQVLHA